MKINKDTPLTLAALKEIGPGDIFKKGTAYIPHPYLRTDEIYVKWCAIKLVTDRWQIHYSFGQKFPRNTGETEVDRVNAKLIPQEQVVNYGLLVRDFTLITELVPCTEEVLKLYKL